MQATCQPKFLLSAQRSEYESKQPREKAPLSAAVAQDCLLILIASPVVYPLRPL